MGVLRRKSDPAADGKDQGAGREVPINQEQKNREDGDTGQLSGSWGGWLLLFPGYRVMEMLISFSLSVYNTQTS